MIGLFLGETDFPNLILNNIKKDSIKYFIIDLSTKGIFKKNKNSKKISIGKFGKILDLIKKKKCKKVLFAGKIAKPNLSSIKLDFKGIYYLPRIIQASKLGDAAILKELIKILNENNIRVIKSNFYNPELTLSKGNFTKIKQDLRVDLPTVGFDTLKDCNKANLKGIVLKSNQNIFLDRKRCINFANKNRIFIKII